MSFDAIAGQSRRQFIKTFALTTASSILAGKTWTAPVLASAAPQAGPDIGAWRIKVSDYPALQNAFGSVRIGPTRIISNRADSVFPTLLINRGENNQFFALDAQCPHEGCIVRAMSASTKISLCPCHSSRFAIDGRVIPGSQANAPLFQYTSRFDGADVLTVEIPDLDFLNVSVSRIANPSDRVELEFLAFSGIDYEVHTRDSFSAAWQAVAFATTPGGQASQTVFRGADDFAKLYVPAASATAFYAIVVRTMNLN